MGKGERGVVAASDPRTAEAGAAVLREGGTAVDAAVVAALVAYVVEPHYCGPGGDAFLLVKSPGEPVAGLDGSGAVPRGMTPEAMAEAGLDQVPARGAQCVTVPGAMAMIEEALGRWGTLSLAEAVAPAISQARDGFTVRPTLATAADRGAASLSGDPVLGPLYVPDGEPVRLGERVANPALAECLAAMGSEGSALLYRGALGEALVRTVAAGGGWLSADDLAVHETVDAGLESASFRGTEVWELPAPTTGPAVLSALRAVEAGGAPVDWASVVEAVDAGLIEAGFDVRNLGRPSPARGDTSYIAAVDGEGRGASFITSVFGDFGSHLGVPELGGPIHNRATTYRFTATQPEVGAKPPHTTIPSVVTRQGDLAYVIGVAGGMMQPQAQVQLLIRMLDEGMTPQEAIDTPRFKVLFGGDLALEPGHPLGDQRPDAVGREPGLEGFGGAQVAGWSDGALLAGADARRGGAVAHA